MGTPKELAQKVFGRRASKYTTSATHADPHILARVVELSSPQPDGSVLDIATGTGHTAFALAPHVRSVIGIDLTPEMLAEAKRLQSRQALANVEFCLANVRRLPFGEACFHLITCRRAAHHFSNIRQALQEMQRTLRAGGRLVIDDRSVPEDDFVDACMNELDRYHDESHVRQYRPSQWRRMLDESGFVVEEVEPYTQHRPLTSLTDGVSPENVQRIHAVLDQLTTAQREALNLVNVDGQPHLNHWYVMVSAVKR